MSGYQSVDWANVKTRLIAEAPLRVNFQSGTDAFICGTHGAANMGAALLAVMVYDGAVWPSNGYSHSSKQLTGCDVGNVAEQMKRGATVSALLDGVNGDAAQAGRGTQMYVSSRG